jgi:hypothetical protein
VKGNAPQPFVGVLYTKGQLCAVKPIAQNRESPGCSLQTYLMHATGYGRHLQ